jgi:hypothetical protein
VALNELSAAANNKESRTRRLPRSTPGQDRRPAQRSRLWPGIGPGILQWTHREEQISNPAMTYTRLGLRGLERAQRSGKQQGKPNEAAAKIDARLRARGSGRA